MIFWASLTVLSIPFYLLGAMGWRLPGLPMLPASALMTFVPMIAASIAVHRRPATGNVRAWLRPMLGWSRRSDAPWLVLALLFMPLVCALEFGVLRLNGSAVPAPSIAPGETAFLFLAFFVGAIGEELGWQGYAYPALRTRMNALVAALLLGTIWALWHVIPFLLMGRSVDWIVWHSLSAVAMRIIIVWVFENAGRQILVAVLFHTMINVAWALFPVSGSYYDPFITFWILAAVAGGIVLLSGPATLIRANLRQNTGDLG